MSSLLKSTETDKGDDVVNAGILLPGTDRRKSRPGKETNPSYVKQTFCDYERSQKGRRKVTVSCGLIFLILFIRNA